MNKDAVLKHIKNYNFLEIEQSSQFQCRKLIKSVDLGEDARAAWNERVNFYSALKMPKITSIIHEN